MRAPRMLEPLRIRDFALLWSGITVALVGDGIFLVALAWQTYELSNSPSALGWISAAYVAPAHGRSPARGRCAHRPLRAAQADDRRRRDPRRHDRRRLSARG